MILHRKCIKFNVGDSALSEYSIIIASDCLPSADVPFDVCYLRQSLTLSCYIRLCLDTELFSQPESRYGAVISD